MRLIDADELIKRIGKWMPKDPCGREQTVEEVVATDIAASVFMEIEETPTAFDKDKVIVELNAWAKASKTAGVNSAHSGLDRKASEYYQESKAYLRAIEIVEKGGIEFLH